MVTHRNDPKPQVVASKRKKQRGSQGTVFTDFGKYLPFLQTALDLFTHKPRIRTSIQAEFSHKSKN
jgi:hypothetical protein